MDPAALALNRENEFWTPPPLWKGKTAFVLASGPSMSAALAERVRGHRTIVINSTVLIAPWADVWFFTDTGVYQRHRDIVETFAGMVATMSRTAKREMPDRVLRVKGAWMDGFPPENAPVIQQGRSSGHTATSLAVAFRAARVGLLGFDMRVVEGREHHHSEYPGARDMEVYEREFVPAFAGWRARAQAVGVEIVNCTPGSAVTEFPFADLDEVLNMERAA